MIKMLFSASFAVCLVLMFGAADAQQTGYGHITGRCMTADGEASSDWRIRFFNVREGVSPFSNEYRMMPDYIVRSGDDGSFSAKLPQGSYYVMAGRDRPGKRGGPPGEGDFVYPPMDGTAHEPYTVTADETTDMGLLSGAVPYKKEWAAKGKTGIKGTVYDSKGRPYKRALVFASTDQEWKGPIFVSDKEADNMGRFIVSVPEGGEYFIKIRSYLYPDIIPVVKGDMTEGVEIHLGDKQKRKKVKE